MPEWTTQQNDAINARGRNILVSAAAGSGKTAVLVERVIKKITDNENPVDIDKLLIVTFTNNAAAEMKSRITKSLKDILRNEPFNKNALIASFCCVVHSGIVFKLLVQALNNLFIFQICSDFIINRFSIGANITIVTIIAGV